MGNDISFRDLKTFSVDFCVRCAGCPPYIYFRSTLLNLLT